jgi:hypothetical protein
MNTTPFINPIFDTREAFNDRVTETELYFDFLEKVLGDDCEFQITATLRYTLISVGYLVLYNLVESSSRIYLNLIHTSLIEEKVALEETTNLIRRVVLDGFKKHNLSDKFINSLSDLRTQIMRECYDTEKIFSGNVDARLLRSVAAKYGFKIPKTCYGLLEVKNKRNDLAHGKVSFVECSSNEAEESVKKYKDHIIHYLSSMADSIEKFVSNKEYCSQCGTAT